MSPEKQRPVLPAGLYGITAERFSAGRSNVDIALAMIAGGIKVIQYREKLADKSLATMMAECRAIRRLTRDAGVLFIINDFPQIAVAVDADGVHVGQDDLPVPEVRRLIGPDRLIGLSTHSPAQAAAAVECGADYLGVGPLFATQTKDNVGAPVGLGYLDHVASHCALPFVAIGGIKESNLGTVLAHGARTVCLVTGIVGAPDVEATVRRLQRLFMPALNGKAYR